MTQTSSTRDSSSHAQDQAHGKASLGPLLCWAVVFADIGSSIYYVPGILYSTVGGLAGFFVLLTMGVFVLLTLKYAEVSQRFPEGGGVVLSRVGFFMQSPWKPDAPDATVAFVCDFFSFSFSFSLAL